MSCQHCATKDDATFVVECEGCRARHSAQIAAEDCAQPVAWRYRHRSAVEWEYTGSSVVADQAQHYTVEPLYAEPVDERRQNFIDGLALYISQLEVVPGNSTLTMMLRNLMKAHGIAKSAGGNDVHHRHA